MNCKDCKGTSTTEVNGMLLIQCPLGFSVLPDKPACKMIDKFKEEK